MPDTGKKPFKNESSIPQKGRGHLSAIIVLLMLLLIANIFLVYEGFQTMQELQSDTSVKTGRLIEILDNANVTFDSDFINNHSYSFDVSAYRKVYVYYEWHDGNPQTTWYACFEALKISSEPKTFTIQNYTLPFEGNFELEVQGPYLKIWPEASRVERGDPMWQRISMAVYLAQ